MLHVHNHDLDDGEYTEIKNLFFIRDLCVFLPNFPLRNKLNISHETIWPDLFLVVQSSKPEGITKIVKFTETIWMTLQLKYNTLCILSDVLKVR